MARTKYQKDANGNSILGTQHGITVTRPWNKEMYDHNDEVAEKMKDLIQSELDRLNPVENPENEDRFRVLAKFICAYGYGAGYPLDAMVEDTNRRLEQAENYWLHQEYPYMVKEGFCPELEVGFVGYDKLS